MIAEAAPEAKPASDLVTVSGYDPDAPPVPKSPSQSSPAFIRPEQMDLWPGHRARWIDAAKRAVLRRFVQHLSNKPWCSTAPQDVGSWVSPAGYALEHPYIQHQAPWRKPWLWIDVDHPFCPEDRFPLAPSLVIVNPYSGAYHAGWELRSPVLYRSKDNPHPQRWLENLRARMETALEADDGFVDHLGKNPLSPEWEISRVGRGLYDLSTIERALDGVEPRPKPKAPDPSQGRNVALFESLRWNAYPLKRQHAEYDEFEAEVEGIAESLNALIGDMVQAGPLSSREVDHIAHSVARWTWLYYTGSGKTAAQRQQDSRRARGLHKTWREEVAARATGKATRKAQAQAMKAQGATNAEIGRALGVHPRSVIRLLTGSGGG